MPSADQREVGDRIEDEQVGTGQMEEIAHHQVGRPCLLQLREAVKHIECVKALALDQVVDVHGKGLEAVGQLDMLDLQPLSRGEDRLVFRKADVDQVSAVPDRLIGEFLRDIAKFVERRHLPDDVVAEADILQRLIHHRDAGLCFFKSCHSESSLIAFP